MKCSVITPPSTPGTCSLWVLLHLKYNSQQWSHRWQIPEPNKLNKGKIALLERGIILSSVAYLAFETYKWKKGQTVVHASIKVDDIIEQADYLYGSGETAKLYELLSQYKDSNDAELLWRLARAARDMALVSTTPQDEKKRLIYESFDSAKKALELNELCWAAHKWYSICLSNVGDYEGIKTKIGNAYIVKEHLERAKELNPKDATTIHIIGVWCYMFADLPWYQVKIASALFGTPPSATFEEALEYFLQAEEVDPNFYSKNLLFLGKTYLKLKNKSLALDWLTKAKDFPARTEEDIEVQKEATDLLKRLGEKI
uniref:Regulator of microtubule dynamics protein 1 n=1 Tax=Xenopus tropicalis TaxID=8364 RepID=A0A6I8RLY5_XENTR